MVNGGLARSGGTQNPDPKHQTPESTMSKNKTAVPPEDDVDTTCLGEPFTKAEVAESPIPHYVRRPTATPPPYSPAPNSGAILPASLADQPPNASAPPDDDLDTTCLGEPITEAEVPDSPIVRCVREPKATMLGQSLAPDSQPILAQSVTAKFLGMKESGFVATDEDFRKLRAEMVSRGVAPDAPINRLIELFSKPEITDEEMVEVFQCFREDYGTADLPPASMAFQNRPPAGWSGGARRRPRGEEPVLDLYLSQVKSGAIPSIHLSEDPASLASLKHSMLAYGQTVPLLVVRDATNPDHVFVINGHRCLQVARELGWMKIKCLVRSIENETEALILHLLENTRRKTVTPYELAVYVELLARQHGVQVRALAELLGYSPSYIYSMLKCLNLPETILSDWKNQHPALTIARVFALIREPDPLSAWQRLRSKYERATQDVAAVPPSDEPADDPTAWEPYRRPTKTALLKVRDLVSRAKMPSTQEGVRELALGLLDYACGKTSQVPHLRVPELRKRSPRASRR